MAGDGGQVRILTIIEEFEIFCIDRIIRCFSKWFVHLYLSKESVNYYDFSARCILDM